MKTSLKDRQAQKNANKLARFVLKYWIELAAGLVGLVAIVLIVFERSELVGFVVNLRQYARLFALQMRTFITERFSLMDLAGIAVGILALVFILWRVRVRIDESPRLRRTTCPRCGGDLRRIHRTQFDRILTYLFFPYGRRYGCADHACGWSGILHRGQHHHHTSTDRASL